MNKKLQIILFFAPLIIIISLSLHIYLHGNIKTDNSLNIEILKSLSSSYNQSQSEKSGSTSRAQSVITDNPQTPEKSDMKYSKDAELYYKYSLAIFEYYSSHFSASEDLLKTLVKEYPQNSKVKLTLAKVYLQKRDLKNAEKYALEALQQNQSDYEIHRLLGQIYLEHYRIDNRDESLKKMISSFEEVLKLNPEDSDEFTLRVLSLIYLQQNKIQKAKIYLKRILLENPSHQMAFDALENIYIDEKDEKSLIDLYNNRIELEPDDLVTTAKLADISFKNKRYDLAEIALKNLVNAFSEKSEDIQKERWASVLKQLGYVYLRKNEAEKALDYLTRSRNTQDDFTSTFYIILTLMQLDNLDTARKEMNTAQKQYKEPDEYLDLQELNCQLLLKENKKDEAIKLIDDLISNNSNNLELKIRRSIILFDSRDYTGANEYLKELYEQYPSDARILFQLGAVNERLKNFKEAEEYFKLSLKLDPNNTVALNYLGYMWADMGINLEEAEKLIRKAIEIDPTNSAYLDSLGWVYFKMKNYSKARFYLEKAVKEGIAGEDIYDHMGDLYYEMKLYDEAVEAWKKALQGKSSDIDYDAIKTKIEKSQNISNR